VIKQKVTKQRRLSIFEKYLTGWVLLCMATGIGIGKFAPGIAFKLNALSIYNVSIPIAICLFFMMYPIMVKIPFREVAKAVRNPKPILLTLFINWAVKPFTMFFFATLFLGFLFRGFIPGTEILKNGQSVDIYRSYIDGSEFSPDVEKVSTTGKESLEIFSLCVKLNPDSIAQPTDHNENYRI